MSTLKAVNFQHPSAVDPAIELESDGSIGGFLGTALDSKLPIAGGKILQIVRATDGTDRTTTSGSFVDVTGMSVTITPQIATSAILIFSSFNTRFSATADGLRHFYALTDNSNNLLSGQGPNGMNIGTQNVTGTSTRQTNNSVLLLGYATPATTSATTYKLRFKVIDTGTITALNGECLGQIYAIEVSA